MQAAKVWRPYAEAALKKSDYELAELARLNSNYDLGAGQTPTTELPGQT